MPTIQVKFDLSLQVEGRLKFMADRDHIGLNAAAVRCIGTAHYVMIKTLKRARFYVALFDLTVLTHRIFVRGRGIRMQYEPEWLL